MERGWLCIHQTCSFLKTHDAFTKKTYPIHTKLNSPNITTIYFWSQNPLISCPNNFTLVYVVTRFCEILLLCINPHIITLVKGQLFAKFGLRSHCSQLEDFRSVDRVWRNRASNTRRHNWVKLTQYLLDALASKKREGILMVNHH